MIFPSGKSPTKLTGGHNAKRICNVQFILKHELHFISHLLLKKLITIFHNSLVVFVNLALYFLAYSDLNHTWPKRKKKTFYQSLINPRAINKSLGRTDRQTRVFRPRNASYGEKPKLPHADLVDSPHPTPPSQLLQCKFSEFSDPPGPYFSVCVLFFGATYVVAFFVFLERTYGLAPYVKLMTIHSAGA